MTSDSSAERSARILIVQDDPVLLGLVSGTLRPDGHQILIAGSPLDALAFTRLEFKRIDLIVTRINLKPISGLELMKRLVRRGIDVPVLFMSASRSLAGVIANSLGQSAVIEEPFTAAELRQSVRRCLSSHRRRTDEVRIQDSGGANAFT